MTTQQESQAWKPSERCQFLVSRPVFSPESSPSAAPGPPNFKLASEYIRVLPGSGGAAAMQSVAAAETGLTITNPLVLYRALVAMKKIEPDPAQHRLALHLQKLYHRLKDYEPAVEYRYQLEQVTRTLARSSAGRTAVAKHAGGNEAAGVPGGRLANLIDTFRSQRAETDSLALMRRLSSHETALHLDSPQGLLLYGEVGTGKSMLVDLLADSLPNRKKKRYHFNAFMLDLFARIERKRLERLKPGVLGFEQEHTLLAMARDMIATSPILFLDEFQLPDRAASKILSILFTSFFQLGGVLVATSNRMPEELARASGIEYAVSSSPTSQLGFPGLRSFLGGVTEGTKRGVNSRQNDFTQFLEVLKARCETWDMEGQTDFRRRESMTRRPRTATNQESSGNAMAVDTVQTQQNGLKNLGGDAEAELDTTRGSLPAFYFPLLPDLLSARSLGEESVWQASILRAVDTPEVSAGDIPWRRETLNVYGRKVSVPKACNGSSLWTFEQLCGAYLGPADYITLASTFHTLILTDVPVLTSVQKNEARRFITLLDALYEARCRLLIRAEAGPDDLFFPDQRRRGAGAEDQEGDSVYAETLSEIYQDQTSPFRPNVSMYESTHRDGEAYGVETEAHADNRSILADEDADFGPVYGAGRSAGASSSSEPAFIQMTGPNFQRTQAFTGQDERFAYKRAESRLWELCGQAWWDHASQPGWWKPLEREARAWEMIDSSFSSAAVVTGTSEEARRDSDEVFRHGASPFRVHQEPPPKMAWTHIWGLMRWGRKAGTWGKGAEGAEDRLREKRELLEQIQTKPRSR